MTLNFIIILKINFHNFIRTFLSFFFSIKLMEQKLDPETLGIIPLFTFMDEFFPRETNSTPDVFTLWHYNGLSLGSNSKVEF